MGMRFRKSYKIAPGIRLNIGKKSAGISMGNKYGGVSINSRTGTKARVSVPGTGLSYQHKIGDTAASERAKDEEVQVGDACTTMLSEEILKSLNDAAFQEYVKGFLAYANTVEASGSSDIPEEYLSVLQQECDRRTGKITKRRRVDFWIFLICGISISISSIVLIFASWLAYISLAFGIFLLILAYHFAP